MIQSANTMPVVTPEDAAAIDRMLMGSHHAEATAPKRSRRRISPEERANRRRKQHRELVARGRARVREQISSLREEQTILQKTIDSLVHVYKDRQKCTSSANGILHATLTGVSLRDRYLEAVALQESIRLENERLEHCIDEHIKFHNVVATTDDSEDASGGAAKDINVLHRRGVWMYFAHDDMPFYYEPYTAERCDELMADAFRHVKRMDEAFENHEYPTMAVHCFEWSVQRMLDASRKHKMRFYFRRQIQGASSRELRDELAAQSWKILNTPKLYAQLYRNNMVEQVLQHVSDHTVIIIRNNPTRNGSMTLRSFNMMRIFSTVDKHGRQQSHIVVLVLSPQDVESAAKQATQGVHYIRAGYTHVAFMEKDDSTLELTYSGMGCLHSEDQAAFLLTEISSVLFRWQQLVFPQRWVTAE